MEQRIVFEDKNVSYKTFLEDPKIRNYHPIHD